MTIEKLPEFASKTDAKNTDQLNLEQGFPVRLKPARQWFNWLFNSLSSKINEIIDKKLDRDEIIDNLTTNDATKVASARTVKELEDNKLEATDLKDATTNQKGIIQVATSLEVVGFEIDNKAITPSSLGEILLPHGAEPIDVTASRLNNTVYTNPYDRILHVSICWRTWQQVNQAFINSKFWGQSIPVNSNSIQSWIYIPVPPRGEYKISLGASGNILKWSEL